MVLTNGCIFPKDIKSYRNMRNRMKKHCQTIHQGIFFGSWQVDFLLLFHLQRKKIVCQRLSEGRDTIFLSYV